MKLRLNKPQIKGDKIIWAVYLFLSVLSLIFVFSAMGKTVYRINGDIMTMFFKQVFIIALSIFAMYVVHRIKYSNYARFVKIAYVLSLIVLVFTWLMGYIFDFGKEANRWLVIPGLAQLQPSEIVKYVLVFYVSSELATLKNKIKEKNEFWKLIWIIGAVCLLIFFENFSTAIIVFLSCFVLMFVAGAKIKHMLPVIAIGLVGIGIVLSLSFVGVELGRNDTWVSRIDGFVNNDPNEDNQYNSAIMAIATGGVSGLGLGNTVQGRFLNESHNDFIFAIILEEGGIFFCCIIFLAYVFLFYRCIQVARGAKGLFGTYLALGISFVIIIQALVNMSVATGLIPVTGQTLPFLSYGGTSFFVSSVALGVILNISSESNKEKQKIEIATEEQENNIEVETNNTEI